MTDKWSTVYIKRITHCSPEEKYEKKDLPCKRLARRFFFFSFNLILYFDASTEKPNFSTKFLKGEFSVANKQNKTGKNI